MKEIKIKRPYGVSNKEAIARAQLLGGFHRSYANYRAERLYIDTYVVPEGVTEAMLLAKPTPEPAPDAEQAHREFCRDLLSRPTSGQERGLEYTVPVGNGQVRKATTRRFTWDD